MKKTKPTNPSKSNDSIWLQRILQVIFWAVPITFILLMLISYRRIHLFDRLAAILGIHDLLLLLLNAIILLFLAYGAYKRNLKREMYLNAITALLLVFTLISVVINRYIVPSGLN